MSFWIPVAIDDMVVGDAIALSDRDRSGLPWTLTGRVRGRDASSIVRLLVEWTKLHGDGRPIWSLWRTHLLAPRHVGDGRLYRHADHGPRPRTNEAGMAMLRSRIAGVSEERIAACIRPGLVSTTVGIDRASRYLRGREAAPEYVVRQLQGDLSAEEARAYDPTVRTWPAST